MLTRRRFIFAFGGSAVAAPLRGFAASPKVHRVGFVAADRRLATGRRMDALRAGLASLGYVEKKNIVLEGYWPGKDGEPDHTLRDLTQSLIDADTDVIVAHGAAAALKIPRALRVQNRPIPLVMATCPDPSRYGVVSNLAHPEGHVTGLADAQDPVSRQLTFLTQAVPGLARVAVLAHAQFPGHPNVVESARAAALKSAISIQSFQFRTPEDLDSAFREMGNARSQALLVSIDSTVDGAAEQVAARATQYKIPTMFGERAQAEAGGLMSYSEDLTDTYRRAAIYVDKLLKGTRPAALPVKEANKFEFVVNRKTAKTLNIELPASLLVRANRIA